MTADDILYWVHTRNVIWTGCVYWCAYACTECLLYAVLFILWSKWSIWWGSDSFLQCSTCRENYQVQNQTGLTATLSLCMLTEATNLYIYCECNWQLTTGVCVLFYSCWEDTWLFFVCHVCVCVCVCVCACACVCVCVYVCVGVCVCVLPVACI